MLLRTEARVCLSVRTLLSVGVLLLLLDPQTGADGWKEGEEMRWSSHRFPFSLDRPWFISPG